MTDNLLKPGPTPAPLTLRDLRQLTAWWQAQGNRGVHDIALSVEQVGELLDDPEYDRMLRGQVPSDRDALPPGCFAYVCGMRLFHEGHTGKPPLTQRLRFLSNREGMSRAAGLLREAADRIEALEAATDTELNALRLIVNRREQTDCNEASVAALLRETFREAAGRPGTLPEVVVAVRRGATPTSEDDIRESPIAEVNGFMADPDRIILRFDGFDVVVPDEAAKGLARQLVAKMPELLLAPGYEEALKSVSLRTSGYFPGVLAPVEDDAQYVDRVRGCFASVRPGVHAESAVFDGGLSTLMDGPDPAPRQVPAPVAIRDFEPERPTLAERAQRFTTTVKTTSDDAKPVEWDHEAGPKNSTED